MPLQAVAVPSVKLSNVTGQYAPSGVELYQPLRVLPAPTILAPSSRRMTCDTSQCSARHQSPAHRLRPLTIGGHGVHEGLIAAEAEDLGHGPGSRS